MEQVENIRYGKVQEGMEIYRYNQFTMSKGKYDTVVRVESFGNFVTVFFKDGQYTDYKWAVVAHKVNSPSAAPKVAQ